MMNLLNHWKLLELRIAIIRDLADFIPEDYYSSAPSNDSMQLARMDWELYMLIGADQKKTPLKYLPRHIAAWNVLKLIVCYDLANSFFHKLNKLPPKNDWPPEQQDNYNVIKHNINITYEMQSSHSNALLEELGNWLRYLSEEEAKPFPKSCLNWSKEVDDKQVKSFFEKFGFLPENIYKAPSAIPAVREQYQQFSETAILAEQENTQPQIQLIGNQDNLGRREQQLEVILAVIDALNYNPQQIPDGGKKKICNICLNRKRLFTEDGFKRAWQEGIADGHFRLENHQKYSPKNNKR